LRAFVIALTMIFGSPVTRSDGPPAAAGIRAARPAKGNALSALSDRLREIQKTIAEKYGVHRIFVGGGSSINLLDHVLMGKPISYRDLDIFVVLDRLVTSDIAKSMGLALESPTLGKFSQKDLRPRPRANPALEGAERYQHNAGFGFFLKGEGNEVIDISLFHSESDLKLNGIFNIDRVMIPLDFPQTLAAWSADFSAGKVRPIDPHAGYAAWTQHQLQIVNWPALEREPALDSLRVIRSYAKNGLTHLRDDEAKRLRGMIADNPPPDTRQFTRNLIKLLGDETAPNQLKMAAQLNALNAISPSLQTLVQNASADDLTKWYSNGLANLKSKGTTRLVRLLELLPIRARIPFVKNLYSIDPETFALSLDRILRPLDGETPLKIGYFTGEFAPFHSGHLDVARSAIEQGGLDLIFVIPSPHVTNAPKTVRFSPVEWKERAEFTALGTQKDLNIVTWPSPEAIDGSTKSESLIGVIQQLEEAAPASVPMTHVMGADSFHRVVARNLIEGDPRPRIVVERAGIPLSAGLTRNPLVRVITPSDPRPISATRNLHYMALGHDPPDLTPAVAERVKRLPRYQKILASLRARHQEIQVASSKLQPLNSSSIFVVNLQENPAGLFLEEIPLPSQFHRSLLQKLTPLPHQKIVFHLNPAFASETTQQEWSRWVKHLNRSDLGIVSDYRSIPRKSRVPVLPSGIANEWIASGELREVLSKSSQAVLVETSSTPLSPLLKATALNSVEVTLPGETPSIPDVTPCPSSVLRALLATP